MMPVTLGDIWGKFDLDMTIVSMGTMAPVVANTAAR